LYTKSEGGASVGAGGRVNMEFL